MNDLEKKFNIHNTHVPDKVYAYMIQSYHMLYTLIDCEQGDVVSMEVIDDVGVEKENHLQEAIQIKSVTTDRNPISNKSIDLWKTLFNWLMAVKERELDVERTKFKLFITTKAKGEIAFDFSNASTDDEVENALNMAKSYFFDEQGNEKDLPDSYATYVRTIFDNGNVNMVKHIIKNFSVEMCVERYSETVKNKLKVLHITEDLINPIFESLIGWINNIIANCVENKKCICTTYDDFIYQVNCLFREYNQKYSLRIKLPTLSNHKIQEELLKKRKYVEQLEIVNAEYEDKLQAINDYFCAVDNRVKLAISGISEEQMTVYENNLKRHWINKKRINDIERKQLSDEEKGLLLYFKCLDDKKDMETCEVPDAFYNGCLHMLSNELDIGWHPRYIEILGDDIDEK